MVMNFLLANLDFPKMAEKNFREIHLHPLTGGLPGQWKRPGLFEAYRQGINDHVFHPALHGTTHFCRYPVEHALSQGGERGELLRTFWKAETPYIYWRMPWVGYEYSNPEKPRAGFLSADVQQGLINEAAKAFRKLFSGGPITACAPGYRDNHDTHAAWAKCGVRVIDFEPTQQELSLEKYLQVADACFARGVPAIISVHSINFHSTLKDFRGPTLRVLDELLSSLESKYPNLLYVHDGDLYEIVTRGRFKSTHGAVSVRVKQQDASNYRSMVRGAE
jgi:hypothetical protein